MEEHRSDQLRRISRRRFVAGMGAVGMGAIASACAPATTPSASGPPASSAAGDLRGTGSVVVYDGGGAWGAAKRAGYFEPFERETGIKVIANPGLAAARILAGIQAGNPGYDVVDISGGRLDSWVKDGLLLPIDYKFWDPTDRAAFSPVPTHEYGVPAIFYSLQMVFSTAKFASNTPKTWADMWDTVKFPGSRSVNAGSTGPGGATIEVALLADGVDPKKLYPLDFDRAFKSLDRIRPSFLKFWGSGAEAPQLVADGQVAVASAWNGRIVDRQQAGGAIAASWEQAILQYDYWVVPKGAKSVENAMKFIAYASRPRPMAKFAELITYSPPNSKAFELIGSERAAILPTAAALKEKQVVQDYAWWNSETAGTKNDRRVVELWEKWLASR